MKYKNLSHENGNVGIGTTAPAEEFVVMGNMTINMTGGEFGADIKVNEAA